MFCSEDFTRHMEFIRGESQKTFLMVHGKMKTLGFAISMLKIREFNTLKTCMKKEMQKKSVARMQRFFEKPRDA